MVPLGFWLHPNHPKFFKPEKESTTGAIPCEKLCKSECIPMSKLCLETGQNSRLDGVPRSVFPQRWTLTPRKYSEIDISDICSEIDILYRISDRYIMIYHIYIYIGCWKLLLNGIILSQIRQNQYPSASVSLSCVPKIPVKQFCIL